MEELKDEVSIFWFRRDLRFEDNRGLYEALSKSKKVLPLFIFDSNIIDELSRNDKRVSFIYSGLLQLEKEFKKYGSGILIRHGDPLEVFDELSLQLRIMDVVCNEDFEPYAMQRDSEVRSFLKMNGIGFTSYFDHLVTRPGIVLKNDGSPYTVFTPFKNKVLNSHDFNIENYPSEELLNHLSNYDYEIPPLNEFGFNDETLELKLKLENIHDYERVRDFPILDATTKAGVHLRFGTISIRKLVQLARDKSEVYLSELLWRDFFAHILFHFPKVVDQSFKPGYDKIQWRNSFDDFEKWCLGKTGYPIVDAGMRELNQTGFMHNRVRMIVASFLVKHLLIDWRWGEAYFADRLLDYELASNNGNWQWAAGSGCDAAPYFRIFNPITQSKKFDKDLKYIKRWAPEYEAHEPVNPMVDHQFARERALETYKQALQS